MTAKKKTTNQKQEAVPEQKEEPMADTGCHEELKAIKAELVEAKQRAKLIDNIPTPVMTIDKDFNVTYMNPKGAGAVGKTPEQCLGQKCFTLFNTGHCNTADCQVAKAMQQNGVFTNDTVAKLPGGDLPIRYTGVPLKDDKGNIVGGLEYVLDISKEMEVADGVLNLVTATVEGKLDTRADVQRFEGNYQRIVQGVNDLVDAFVAPINVTAEYVDRISKGDIPPEITDTYNGDFNEIKNNLNQCITVMNGLLAETDKLIKATVAGQLDTRGDAEGFPGGWGTLVGGVNNLVDAFVAPINVTAEYVDRISKGDIPPEITDTYNGDFNEIKNNLNNLIKALNQIATAAQQIADGDLTVNLEIRSQQDELMKALSTMVKNTAELIGQIQENANIMAESSDQMNSAANQAGAASQQVATTSQQIAKGAGDQATMLQTSVSSIQQLEGVVDQVAKGSQEQSEGIGNATTAVNQVSAAAQQVAQNSQAASDGSRTAAELANSGADKTNQTVAGMNKITAKVDVASGKVNELGRASEEIGKIVATIDDIAAQTNLLALNAAIEAARAGEHGRGFAVVSDEVRKLAERTVDATKEIADLVNNVQAGVGDAVKAMDEGTNEVKEGFTLASEAGDALNEILKASQEVSDQISQISAAAQEMNANAEELVTIIDSVGAVTEENTAAAQQMTASSQEVGKAVESAASIAEQSSAGTEQMSAAAEEMGGQVQEIVASSGSLKQMAEELKQAAGQFRISNGQSAVKTAG